MTFVVSYLLDVAGIEETELTKRECMKNIKETYSKDLEHLCTINVRKYFMLERRLIIVFTMMVVIVLERIVIIVIQTFYVRVYMQTLAICPVDSYHNPAMAPRLTTR